MRGRIDSGALVAASILILARDPCFAMLQSHRQGSAVLLPHVANDEACDSVMVCCTICPELYRRACPHRLCTFFRRCSVASTVSAAMHWCMLLQEIEINILTSSDDEAWDARANCFAATHGLLASINPTNQACFCTRAALSFRRLAGPDCLAPRPVCPHRAQSTLLLHCELSHHCCRCNANAVLAVWTSTWSGHAAFVGHHVYMCASQVAGLYCFVVLPRYGCVTPHFQRSRSSAIKARGHRSGVAHIPTPGMFSCRALLCRSTFFGER